MVPVPGVSKWACPEALLDLGEGFDDRVLARTRRSACAADADCRVQAARAGSVQLVGDV
jgi:hypothetical protein